MELFFIDSESGSLEALQQVPARLLCRVGHEAEAQTGASQSVCVSGGREDATASNEA